MSDVPEGYRMGEVGVIPEEWEVKKFTECAELKHGFQFRDEHFSKDGVMVTKIGTLIAGGGLDLSDASFIPAQDFNKFSKYVLKQDDVLMALTGATLGKVSIVDTSQITLQNYRVGNFINKNNVYKKYIYYLLQSKYIQKKIKGLVNEAAQPNLGKQDFDKFIVPIPSSIEEQQAIASALSDMDTLITALEQLITKKRNIKQGAMQQLLTGEKRLPGFGGAWEVKELNDLCNYINDGTHHTPKYVDGGVPFYSVENVTANNFSDTKFISQNAHNELIKRCKPEKGDILLTRIGTLGETKLIDWNVNASIYVSLALLKINDQIDSNYFYRYTKSRQFVKGIEKRSLLNAVPQKINMGDIGNVQINFPPTIKEQTAIAQILSDMDAEIESLEQKQDKYKAIKQGMMQELLTGKTRLV